jgi:hypothetical protein
MPPGKPVALHLDKATTEMNSGESEQRNRANVAANCCLHPDKPEWKAQHLIPSRPDGQGLPLHPYLWRTRNKMS